MTRLYRLSALKLLSDIELPELMPWDGRSAASTELVFRLGSVAARLEAPDYIGAHFQTQGRDRYLMIVPNGTRILVENGREVTIEPGPGADLADARACLMGPVQAVLWHQCGLLPLHASAVSVAGRVLALAGPSGAGKSTLAAVLSAAGHEVMSDDICVVDVANDAYVLPTARRLRLWHDALDYLGIAADNLPRALSRSEKYLIESGDRIPAEPRKLASVVLLSRRAAGGIAIEQRRGARGVVALWDVIHMLGAARALGREPAVFEAVTRSMLAGVTVWQLDMPDDLTCLEEAAATALTALKQ